MNSLRAVLERFVAESNRVEGIHRDPTPEEVTETERFVTAPTVDRVSVIHLTGVFQPGAVLRDRPGLNVTIGDHRAPSGGPSIPLALDGILARADLGEHPYWVHHAYETLDPFTDGNGRSGRALWLWGMRRRPKEWQQALHVGFLHCWYYQSLSLRRRTGTHR